jgi:dephospho-CoA kinase
MIIGITGTLGAGKGTVVEYLVKHKGFTHYSVRGFLRDEIIKRRLEVNRDTMVVTANDLRATFGASYITDCLYEQAVTYGGNAVIESIRAVGEIVSLHKLSEQREEKFILLAVDALPEVRYKRILERASETDHITYQQFINNEKREMTNDDPFKQNIAACMALADIILRNDNTVEEFYKDVEKVYERTKQTSRLG